MITAARQRTVAPTTTASGTGSAMPSTSLAVPTSQSSCEATTTTTITVTTAAPSTSTAATSIVVTTTAGSSASNVPSTSDPIMSVEEAGSILASLKGMSTSSPIPSTVVNLPKSLPPATTSAAPLPVQQSAQSSTSSAPTRATISIVNPTTGKQQGMPIIKIYKPVAGTTKIQVVPAATATQSAVPSTATQKMISLPGAKQPAQAGAPSSGKSVLKPTISAGKSDAGIIFGNCGCGSRKAKHTGQIFFICLNKLCKRLSCKFGKCLFDTDTLPKLILHEKTCPHRPVPVPLPGEKKVGLEKCGACRKVEKKRERKIKTDRCSICHINWCLIEQCDHEYFSPTILSNHQKEAHSAVLANYQ